MIVSGLFMAAILVAPSLQQVTCNMSNRFESCTDGFCCARDDFQIHIIYCKKIGYEGDHCSTRPSSFDCPCHDGLYCKPNIAGHLNSLYGTCRRDKAINNTTAATTTTTSKPDVQFNLWNSTDLMSSDITTGPACNMTDRFKNTCPPGYCCCQNDFLQDGIYCRRLGLQNDTCSVNSDDTSYCPCSAPFTCRPNLMTATFVSTYGKCTKPEHMPTVIG